MKFSQRRKLYQEAPHPFCFSCTFHWNRIHHLASSTERVSRSHIPMLHILMKTVCGVTLTTWNFCWTPSTSNSGLFFFWFQNLLSSWNYGTWEMVGWLVGLGDVFIYLVGDSFVWKGEEGSVFWKDIIQLMRPNPHHAWWVDSLIDVTLVFAKH